MESLRRGRKVAAAATFATLLLTAVKAVVGYLSGSAALLADAVHSGSDVVAIFASWLGLKFAERKPTETFPYGFYKAETLATFLISGFILYAGVELLIEGVRKLGTTSDIDMPFLAMGVSLVSSAAALLIAVWEKKVGREINSQSLIANAEESQLDIISSLIVFAAILSSHLHVPHVEGAVTVAIASLVIWIGLKNGRISIYGLMDASLDPHLEEEIRGLIAGVPGVRDVGDVRIRRAGPFIFGDVGIEVERSLDVNRGHEISHRVVREVRARLPQVESLTVHIEPFIPSERKVMMPVESSEGLLSRISPHFGRAGFFAFVELSGDVVEGFYIRENPFRGKRVRAGLAVVNRFIEEGRVDTVIVREIGEIGFHTLSDHYIDIYRAEGNTVKEVLQKLISGSLPRLEEPTHGSEEGISADQDGSKG